MARKLKQDNLYFETIDTEYKSYILGFIFADGSIYDGRTKDRPNRQLRLSIYCASSDDYIFDKLLQDNEDISKTISIRKERENEVPISVIRVTSNALCNKLISLGCNINKSKIGMTFPDLPPDLIPHFIRGFLDGDGSILHTKHKYSYQRVSNYKLNKKPKEFIHKLRIAFISTDKLFLDKIVFYLKLNSFSYTKKGNCNTLWIDNLQEVKNSLNYLYNNANYYLTRKVDKVNEYLKAISSQAEDTSSEGSTTT